jgi:hypothetical protein
MGLLKSVVLLPLAPVEGVVWIAEKIQAQVERDMFGTDAFWQELAELGVALDEGRIGEAEFEAAEAELLDRLEAMEGEVIP